MSLRVSTPSGLSSACSGLMYKGVPIICVKAVCSDMFGKLLVHRFGNSEIDDLGRGLAVFDRHQHVGRLQVAVNDSFLMGMLHRLADGDKQFQPFAHW